MRAGLASLLLLPALAARSDCVPAGPEAVARYVYLRHFDFALHPASADGYVSGELLALLRKEAACPPRASCALDWNPWTGAQDGDIVGAPAFRRISETTNRSIVVMTFRYSADGEEPYAPLRQTKVTLLRERPGDCWKIGDLEPATGGASLMKALAEYWGREL